MAGASSCLRYVSRMRFGRVLFVTSLGAGVALIGPSAFAAPVDEDFAFTGSPQTYVVPDGVCAVTIVARGAEGGQGADGAEPLIPGGLGAEVSGTIAVTPGQVLTVDVGGAGGDGEAGNPGAGGYG